MVCLAPLFQTLKTRRSSTVSGALSFGWALEIFISSLQALVNPIEVSEGSQVKLLELFGDGVLWLGNSLVHLLLQKHRLLASDFLTHCINCEAIAYGAHVQKISEEVAASDGG